MKKSTAMNSELFRRQSQETVSLAFALCEERIKSNRCNITPELKALAAAALSLEKAVAVYIAVERLFAE